MTLSLPLYTLLAECPEAVITPARANPIIDHLANDSRDVRANTLFAALAGTSAHGLTFLDDARARGAVAVLVDSSLDVTIFKSKMVDVNAVADMPVVRVPNAAHALAHLAARFYAPLPSSCVAVTGTSGKTSVAEFTRQLWQALGMPAHAVASVGTLGVVRGDGSREAGSLTTPDSITLARTLNRLHDAGVTHIALEASSHGLAQHRLDGLDVRAAAFTNLSRDHLDWHKTMAAYFAAKGRLFTDLLRSGGTAVLNADIPEYAPLCEMVRARGCRMVDYGTNATCLRMTSIQPTQRGITLTFEDDGQTNTVALDVYGTFQAWNILAAWGLVRATLDQNLPTAHLHAALTTLRPPAGRMERMGITRNGAIVFVDYAHKPEALRHVLCALRPHVRTGGHLHVVFGCGGNRDTGKRPMMGAIAHEHADQVIITDDNPRDEDPDAIRRAIVAGIPSDAPNVHVIADRAKAIAVACQNAKAGDCVLIAGKGHETGQIVAGVTIPFDDRAVVRGLNVFAS